jgi:hypothetical protein
MSYSTQYTLQWDALLVLVPCILQREKAKEVLGCKFGASFLREVNRKSHSMILTSNHRVPSTSNRRMTKRCNQGDAEKKNPRASHAEGKS